MCACKFEINCFFTYNIRLSSHSTDCNNIIIMLIIITKTFVIKIIHHKGLQGFKNFEM